MAEVVFLHVFEITFSRNEAQLAMRVKTTDRVVLLLRKYAVHFVLCIQIFSYASTAHGQEFALHDGDTVVFYGDSITAQRIYTRFVEEAVLTRYPAMHVRFVNAGVPGDIVYGGYAGATAERVARDVGPYHPSMITVMLGMNDGGYVPYSDKIDQAFQSGYLDLLRSLLKAAPEARLTLILPSPYDEVTHGTDFPGYSAVVRRNAEDVAKIAAQMQAEHPGRVFVADFSGPVFEALQKAKAKSPELAQLIIPDRIHPGDVGHWIMAANLLSVWHMDPVVSSVFLHAADATVAAQKRTSVSGLARTASGLQWTQKDEALPLPLSPDDPLTRLLLLRISNIEGLDQQTLRVDGLTEGEYDLQIDGKPVATFTRAQLLAGVNLALQKTPMLDQARGIDWYEQRRTALDLSKFVLVAELPKTDDLPSAERALNQGGDALAATAREKIEPASHTFELRRK